jgi:hypothetical protein
MLMSCKVSGVVSVLYPSRWSWSFRLFLGRPMLLFPFGLHFSAFLGILSVSILSTCCCRLSLVLSYFQNNVLPSYFLPDGLISFPV